MNAGVHQYEDKLLDYAYGELPAHEAAAVDAHVRTCAKCSQSLAQIRGVRSVFAPLPMEAAPDAGLESLLAYAEQHARRTKAPKEAPWRRWVLALASAAGLVVVGVVAVRAADESPQSSAQIIADAKRAEVQATESLKKMEPVLAELPTQAPSGAVARDPVAASPKPMEAQAQYGGEREGKRGSVEQKEWAPADKLVAKKPRSPSPPSSSSGGSGNDFDSLFGDSAKAANEAPAEKKADLARSSETRRGLRDDYGNAGRAVALQETKDEAPKRELSGNKKLEAQPREQNNVDDQLNDGTTAKQGVGGTASPGSGFGLGTGSSAGGLGRGSVENAARPPSSLPVPQTMPPPPPAKSKGGYGLPSAPAPSPVAAPEPQAGPRERARSEAVVDSAAYADEESKPEISVAQRKSAEADRRAQVQIDVRRFLDEARVASKQGDRRGEVLAAANALKAGATGYERAEALRRACDAHEAMQEFDRAEAYCERLLSEFSGTVAARQVMERRAKATGKKVAPMKAAPADVGASEAAQ